MLPANKKVVLVQMVEEYSLKEVVEALVWLSRERANDCSDMSLKEKAIAWSETAELLDEVVDKIDR